MEGGITEVRKVGLSGSQLRRLCTSRGVTRLVLTPSGRIVTSESIPRGH